MRGIKKLAVSLLEVLDLQDCLFWMGFACLMYGCWQVYAPSAAIVGGVLLIAVSIYSATRKANQ